MERRPLDRTHLQRVFEFSLLGMLASGYLAVLGSGALDAVTAILGGCALVARLLHLIGWMPLRLPSRWVTYATVAYLFVYPLDYLFVSKEFLASTVHLVFFVAVAKLLSAATPRDFLFLKIIAFLELLAASLLSDNLSFFIFLVIFVFCTVATFASSEMLASWEQRQVVSRGLRYFPRRFGLLTFLTAGGILVITAALFFVLPRTARAALDRLVPANRVGGLSNEVTLGQVGELRRSSTAVMHVKFDGIVPGGVKYRGSSLGEFNGWKWYNSPQPGRPVRGAGGLFKLAGDDQLRRAGRRVNYEILIRGMTADQIFLIGTPEYLRLAKPQILDMPFGGFRLPWPEPDGIRYAAHSYPPTVLAPTPANLLTPPSANGPRIAETDRNFYLRLPPVDPRLMPLAQQMAGGSKSDLERAARIEEVLRTKFGYSLEPLLRQVDDPLAYFLLERKKGHCEYFASSMAVLLRLLWIPSRVVTGFQVGTYNPVSGWHVVRGSDAHSWVEAWIPGRGWVEFDPTPADPDGARNRGVFAQISLMMDAADIFWQDWIVGYDLERQVDLALKVERSSRKFRWEWVDDFAASFRKFASTTGRVDARKIGWLLIIVALVVLAWFFGPRLWKHLMRRLRVRRIVAGSAARSEAGVLYESLLDLLRRRGIEKPSWMTPREFSETLPDSPAAYAVREFTSGYYELRFGGVIGRGPELVRLLDRIRQIPDLKA